MQMQKWELIFVGHIQGVGFRYTCSQIAKRQRVSGWVRNLADGTVELHIQGPIKDLEEFLATLETENHGSIQSVSKTIAAVESSLGGFEIRS